MTRREATSTLFLLSGATMARPAAFRTLAAAKADAQAAIADRPADDDEEDRLILHWEEVSPAGRAGRQWRTGAGRHDLVIEEVPFHDA